MVDKSYFSSPEYHQLNHRRFQLIQHKNRHTLSPMFYLSLGRFILVLWKIMND